MRRALNAITSLGEAWWAVGLVGTEELSTLYEFRLGLKSKDPDIDGQALIGEAAAVELEAQRGLKRYFSGQIVKVQAQGKRGRHWYYEAILAPKLWHASRRSDFKIWQKLSVPDIAAEVLSNNAIRCEWRLKNSYKTWEYLVQYGETDLNFLCRLFEHEGIYYWFEHGTDGETLILGDHFSTHEPFGGYENIPYYPPDVSRADEDHYHGWGSAREPEPGRFEHRDYDFRHPSQDLTARHIDPRQHLFDQYEIYSYPGDYVVSGDGEAYARVRLEALQRNQDTIALDGPVRGAVPGCRFKLRNHPRKDQNREFLITRAEYFIDNSDYEAAGESPAGMHHHVKIEAMPADRQYRSPLKTPKPRTRGPETAVVVGPAGSEIHTDQYGRVKVHFHWDRYGQKDGNDSCWIRVAHPWAGSNFGSIHIPRIGQEVIVDFEHGDPDRPIITGRVYNAEQMPPWDLPTNKTQSGILTRSSLGGTPENANALRFEDAKGEEQVWLHAERNQDIEVERNETHWVGQDRKKTIDRDETTVVHRHRTETVDGNEKITIHKNRKKTVDLTETDLIGLIKTETVGVANIDTVGATRVTNVGGAYSLNVGALMNTLVGQQQSTQIGSAKLLSVGKSYEANIGETLKFNVGQSIEFICGASKIMLTSEGGVYLQGKHLEFIGQSGINADAKLVQLNCGAAQSVPGAGNSKEEEIEMETENPEDAVPEEEVAPAPRHEESEKDFVGEAFQLGSGVMTAIADKAPDAVGAVSGLAGVAASAVSSASSIFGESGGLDSTLGAMGGGFSGAAGAIPSALGAMSEAKISPDLAKLGVHGINPAGKF